MSSVINNSVSNFNGGAPESRDFVPSILFSVMLALTLPVLIWRIFSKKHGSWININTLLFSLTRLVSQIMRAYMSRRSYGNKTLVAELVLVSIGYLFLANAGIDLFQRYATSRVNHKYERRTGLEAGAEHSSDWDQRTAVEEHERKEKHLVVKVVATILRLMLLTALVTAIAAAAILSRSLDNNDLPTYIDRLLKASYILSLAATVLGVVSTIVTHFTNKRSLKRTVLLLSYSIPLLVVGIYRVVEIFAPRLRATYNALIAFWVCVIAFEFIAYSWLLAVSIPKWFGKVSDKLHHRDGHNEKRSAEVRR